MRGPERTEILTVPGFSSRSVMPQSVPSTNAARELSSSISASVACISSRRDSGMDMTTTRSLSYSSISDAMRLSMARRTFDLVRNSALFTADTSTCSINAAAMRWVRAVVLA